MTVTAAATTPTRRTTAVGTVTTPTRKTGTHHGPQVQLNLKSLHGVSWRADRDAENVTRPSMVAVVAFTGSAANMEVSSSTMCSRTGHLVIESSPLRMDGQKQQDRPDRICPLYTTFHRRCRNSTPRQTVASPTPSLTPSVSSTCSSSVASNQPHVRVRLPQPNLRLPSISFEMSNRSCRIVRQSPTYQQSVDSFLSNAQDDARIDDEHEDDTQPHTIDSVVTSNWMEESEESMPEILELHVSIRSDDNRILQEGIAHLVLFGNTTGCNITTVEVPIKRHCSVDPSETNPGVIFEDDAFVRMQVHIDTGDDVSSPSLSRRTIRTADCSILSDGGHDESEVVDDEDDEDMDDPLDVWHVEERQRHYEEQLEEARVKTAHMAFDDLGHQHRRKISCGQLDVGQIFHTFIDAFQCGDKIDKEDEDFGGATVNDASTMQSTIATRASLDLWHA